MDKASNSVKYYTPQEIKDKYNIQRTTFHSRCKKLQLLQSDNSLPEFISEENMYLILNLDKGYETGVRASNNIIYVTRNTETYPSMLNYLTLTQLKRLKNESIRPIKISRI